MNKELEELIVKVRALPPMTRKQQRLQSLDFAYGNLACSTNHKPSFRAFAKIFKAEGFSKEEFLDWAWDQEWTR